MNAPGRFSSHQIEAVRHRTKLSDIIKRTIPLVGKGPEWEALCPFHKENTPSFTVNDDKGFYHCFGCGAHGDIFEWLDKQHGLPFVEAMQQLASDAGLSLANAKMTPADAKAIARDQAKRQEDARDKRRSAVGLWTHAMPMQGTPAQRYLEGRGFDFAKLGHFPGAIRYRGDVPHGPTGERLPAMLALMLRYDEPVAVHRTFLQFRDNRWQKLKRVDEKKTARFRELNPGSSRQIYHKNKMVLGDATGAYIPLWKGKDKSPLGRIAPGLPVLTSEGIEDGLSIPMLGRTDDRVIAAYSLDNIGNIVLPPQAGDHILIAQNDPPTPPDKERGPREQFENSVRKLQTANKSAGIDRRVQALWPAPAFKDFNDILTGRRMDK